MLSADQLHAVREAVRGEDWHAVRLEDIAQAAGVSRMTLHRHGIGKDDVLQAIAELLEVEHAQAAFPALVSEADAVTRLTLALEGVCDVDERYLGLIEGLGTNLQDVFHEDKPGPVNTRESFAGALKRILLDGKAEGTLDPGPDPERTATLLFNAAGWTYRHLRSGHRWTPETAKAEVVQLLVRGVRA